MRKTWNIPAERTEYCPNCGAELTRVEEAIGGFAGHPFVHTGALIAYNCDKCKRYFPIGEFLMLKLEKEKTGVGTHPEFVRDYLKDIRAILKSFSFYVIMAICAIFYGNFWAGIAIGFLIVLFLPVLGRAIESLFVLICEFRRAIKEELKPHNHKPGKPDDPPKTP